MAQRCHTGKTRLVECKQKAWEGSVAHHEHVGAKSETGEATVTRVDDHSGHGGVNFGHGSSGDCDVQNEQSAGHRASREQGGAIGALSKSNGSPESAGHNCASTTVRLLATRKKGAHSRFPANSSDQGWLARFARRRQS